MKHPYEQDDGDGRYTRMCLWNHPGDDLTGIISRSRKFVATCESVRIFLFYLLQVGVICATLYLTFDISSVWVAIYQMVR